MPTFQFRRGLFAGLPVGANGEPLWTTDTHQFFISQGGVNYEIGGDTGGYEPGDIIPLEDGGTGSNLADPDEDILLGWHEDSNTVTWITIGDYLVMTGTRLDVVLDGYLMNEDGGSTANGQYARADVFDGITTRSHLLMDFAGAAAVDPTVNDDSDDTSWNITRMSHWLNGLNDTIWVCHDATPGAAVWYQLLTTFSPLPTPTGLGGIYQIPYMDPAGETTFVQDLVAALIACGAMAAS